MDENIFKELIARLSFWGNVQMPISSIKSKGYKDSEDFFIHIDLNNNAKSFNSAILYNKEEYVNALLSEFKKCAKSLFDQFTIKDFKFIDNNSIEFIFCVFDEEDDPLYSIEGEVFED